jgi:energy-coupling factor transporter ATP-binding protein EcfA2
VLDPSRNIEQLLRLIRFRATEEGRLASDLQTRLQQAETHYASSSTDLANRLTSEIETSQREYAELKEDIEDEFEAHYGEADREYKEKQVEANRAYSKAVNEAEKEFEDAKWMVNSVYDKSGEDSVSHQYELFRSRSKKEREFLETQAKELDGFLDEAGTMLKLKKSGTDITVQLPAVNGLGSDELHELHVSSTEKAGNALAKLNKLWLVRQFKGIRPLILLVILWVIAVPAAFAFVGDPMQLINDFSGIETNDLMTAIGIGTGVTFFAMVVLYAVGRGQAMRQVGIMQEASVTAAASRREWLSVGKREGERLKKGAQKWAEEQKVHRRKALGKADGVRKNAVAAADAELKQQLQELSDRYTPELKNLENRRDRRMREANEKYPALSSSLDSRLTSQQQLMVKQHEDNIARINGELFASWTEMSNTWINGFKDFSDSYDRLTTNVSEQFPNWSELTNEWNAPKAPAEVIPVGQLGVDLKNIEGGVSQDERLLVEPTEFNVPALLRFPDEMSLLLKTDDGGRDEGIALLQTTMLRLLTSLPPGKVRFTIVDPVGLGENFSAFMHLTDYDDVLVNSRIWTEEQQISKRLLDLTEHMENVFQTYLRNEFATIQEYNKKAGEVAEPYHFLVVANFPFNFSDEAAKRLTSIMSSGPRCGVHVLMSYDDRSDMPRDFQIGDLAKYATCMDWKKDRFVWNHDTYKNLPLTLQLPPDSNEFSQIVRNVGEQSRDARHVEVAFERIAPNEDTMWTADSRKGISCPLGRAGATKLQHMNLGRGTSQHVMIAGKTGSGKSTLLHILITNTALHYSADEIEFYLIDFKKGVEFKTYAANRLPHARVIAIESDREFGLSVLQRLDAVLQERGDLYRDEGVQDIASYRDANPGVVMPRMMLVIDEFQEFFVDDDQIAQQAGLLLDRLVRQGRAFGIHVLLGSQTLGGAYSLARSTMGQIAVRIALQCSEADSHLILSEENMAARLLARPGEAIYNDSNGSVEGNHPFQIAWLDEERRERFLHRMNQQADPKKLRPMVVFEGNIPADPANNVALLRSIRNEDTKSAPQTIQLWMGEPVAIKESTKVSLRRQSGHNMLIVGQNDTLARGTLLMSTISAAAQLTPEPASPNADVARFYVFDVGDRSEDDAVWNTLDERLPHKVKVVGLRDVEAAVTEIRDEISRRDSENLVDAPPIYLVVNGLSRFRDLRKGDDDFGFGGFDSGEAKATSNKLFAEIIKEGPSLGVHALVWCDTYSNATRWASTQTLREFELRVCFQLNATDSSNLIDSPIASRLGPNRALLYVEEVGSAEKFRPYGTASAEWLDQTAREISGDVPASEEPQMAATVSEQTDESEVVDELDGWTIE